MAAPRTSLLCKGDDHEESGKKGKWVPKGAFSTHARCANAGNTYVVSGYASDYKCEPIYPGYALSVWR
jgi:hypothetical protein